MRGRGALAVAVVAWTAAPAAAGPLYRDPPGYQGVRTAPKTQAAPAPKAPPPLTLAANGNNPDVVVDEAGTAHVVFNRPGDTLPDSVGYCRIKRGATACDVTATLQSEIAPGDPNAAFDDATSLKIVRVGEQLLVFSKRYPIVRPKPDGASSSTVIAWASGDGGTTWTQTPTTVGKRNFDDMVVLGGAEDAAVLAMGIDPFCAADGAAAVCLAQYRSGRYAAEEGNLSAAPDGNYEPNLVLDDQGRPVLSAQDLNNDTSVRRWRGTGSPLDAAQWTAPTVIAADQGSLAGGPAGVFLMAKPPSGAGPYSVRRLNPQGEGYVEGAARAISPERDNVLGELHQGPDGRLVAAWSQRDRGLLLREANTAAAGRPSFGPATKLADGAANGQIALGTTADGGGFAVFNHTGDIVGDGEIQVAGFGSQLATGQPGVADVSGGGLTPSGSCGQLSFGSFTAQTAQGCLLKGKGERANDYVTDGELNLWGVRLVPDAGTKIIINPKTLELNTTGDVRVMVSAPAPVGDVVLFHGRIQRDLSKVTPGTNLFEFPSGPFDAELLGFDVAGGIDVRLERDGVHIPLDITLPDVFLGFTGKAELVADRERGLHVESIKIHIGPIGLGVLTIDSLDLSYEGGELWSGHGKVSVPAGASLELTASFANGGFKGGTFTVNPGSPIPIGPAVFLLDFGGGLFVDPLRINLNATVGAGTPAGNRFPVEVDGDLTMTFPPDDPAEFLMKGTVSVFMFQVADGRLLFRTDGYATFHGHAGVALGPLEADVDMDGFVDAPTAQWGATLKGRVALCVVVDVELDEVRVCGDVQGGAAVSSKGFAACARINPPDPIGGFEVGLTYPWEDWNPVFLNNPPAAAASLIGHLGGCHVEEYTAVPPRARTAQAGGAFSVTVPGGLPSRSILLRGDGGRPKVTVTGPDGRPAGTTIAVEGGNATYVLLDQPAAGDYTITPRAGSPAVTAVLAADGYEPARVKATLGGKHRKRTIRYALSRMGHGQSVAFQERGRFGTHVLGTAKGTRGSLRFRPADAAGGRRTVEALIRRDGIVTDVVRIGSYMAPGPERPGRVRRLRGIRRGNSLVVRWAPARRAAQYAVTVRGPRGLRLGQLVGRRARSATFASVRADERVRVSVRALSTELRPGPRSSHTLDPRR